MKSRIASIIVCLFFVACAATNEEVGAGGSELETTEAGVATGALIGAGVGALVGSTAGEAGAGVVLGSIAGATSGGLIGKSIEDQEKRIDRHDERSGISTKKTASSSSSSRGSLVDTIWSRPESSLNSNFNRPSGTKGRAAKYIDSPVDSESQLGFNSKSKNDSRFVQVRQDRSTSSAPSVPTTISNAASNKKTFGSADIISRSESALPPANRTPTIELQKPKPELPSLSNIPSRKPNLSDQSTAGVKYSNLDLSKEKALKDLKAKEASRAKLIEAPIKQKVDSALGVAKTKIEAPAEIVNQAALVEVAKEVTAPVKTTSAVCESGEKDLERANKSASDSDKVFYLRRVILACPKESSAKIQLGKVYSRLGLKDEARKEFNSVLEADPANETAQDEMSIMMLDSRKN